MRGRQAAFFVDPREWCERGDEQHDAEQHRALQAEGELQKTDAENTEDRRELREQPPETEQFGRALRGREGSDQCAPD